VEFQFGRWVDSVLMQEESGEGDRFLPGASTKRGAKESSRKMDSIIARAYAGIAVLLRYLS
jgi:hypothetical protein